MGDDGHLLGYMAGRLPYTLPLLAVAVTAMWFTVRRLAACPAALLLAFFAFLSLAAYAFALSAVLAVVDFGVPNDPRRAELISWWNIGGYGALLLGLSLLIAAAFANRRHD